MVQQEWANKRSELEKICRQAKKHVAKWPAWKKEEARQALHVKSQDWYFGFLGTRVDVE